MSTFHVQAAPAIHEIDFDAIAERFGMPVHYVADQEGTHAEWTWRAERAVVVPSTIAPLESAILDGSVIGAHAMTNRAGTGGAEITRHFTDAVHAINPDLPSFGYFPESRRARGQRKPSGYMGGLLLDQLIEVSGEKFAVVFVGDKKSDMEEARQMSASRGERPVVGFMVPRLGESDHPLDTLAGKRRKAQAYYEQLASSGTRDFLRS